MNFRYALRSLARDRGFATIAVLMLGLGIGANTAIFSLINGILLQAVPFRDSGRMVVIEEGIPRLLQSFGPLPVNAHHFFEWRDKCKSLEKLAAIDSHRYTLSGTGETEQVSVASISASLFPLLGVQPSLGRNFLDEEDRPGYNREVILTDALWRSRFSADPTIIGRTILLDGAPNVVVGVMPRGFQFFANHQLSTIVALEPRTDLFRPIGLNLDGSWMGEFNYMAIAKLKPGVSREQALAELNVVQNGIVARLSAEQREELSTLLTPLKDKITGQTRTGLLVVLAAVGAVLLVVCVNLANLMLARAVARRRDAAIRTALGASSGALIREVLAESLTLSVAGGILGVAAAFGGVRLLLQAAPVDLPSLNAIRVDGPVLTFALALTIATGLCFGILPAIRLARAEPADALRSGGRSATEGVRGFRIRNLLVGCEVALSAMLLIAAGLLLHSFIRLMRIDRGFETERVIAADLMLPGAKYKEAAAREQFYDRLLPKLRTIPGVISTGLVSVLPLEGEGWTDVITVEGDHTPTMKRPFANFRFISPGYLSAIGIPLIAGRPLEDRDRHSMPAVISESVAKRIYPGLNPLGRKFRRGDEKEAPFEVVGVVRDTFAANLQQPPARTVYVPYWFRSRMGFTAVARTAQDPALVGAAIRSIVRDVDGDASVAQLRTMSQVVAHSVAPRLFQLTLILIFGVSALILASFGIYGVVAYMVTQRRNEIGIRMALGARTSHVHRMILRQGLRPVFAGLAIGITGALVISRMLGGLLFQVSAYDPWTFAGVSGTLLVAAALACFVPSVRATNADPASVLRYE
jgi:putative ABC transport system permease protein